MNTAAQYREDCLVEGCSSTLSIWSNREDLKIGSSHLVDKWRLYSFLMNATEQNASVVLVMWPNLLVFHWAKDATQTWPLGYSHSLSCKVNVIYWKSMQTKRWNCQLHDDDDNEDQAATLHRSTTKTNEVWLRVEHFPFQDWFWNRRDCERTAQVVIGVPLPRQCISRWCCSWNSWASWAETLKLR